MIDVIDRKGIDMPLTLSCALSEGPNRSWTCTVKILTPEEL
jgi:hypothetical protein